MASNTGMITSQAPRFDYDSFLQQTTTQNPMAFYVNRQLSAAVDSQDRSLYLRLSVYTSVTDTTVEIIQRVFKNAQGELCSPIFSLGSDGSVYDSPLLPRRPYGTEFLEKILSCQIIERRLQQYHIYKERGVPIRNSRMTRTIKLLQQSSTPGLPRR